MCACVRSGGGGGGEDKMWSFVNYKFLSMQGNGDSMQDETDYYNHSPSFHVVCVRYLSNNMVLG